jgi:uncharacterized protein YacL
VRSVPLMPSVIPRIVWILLGAWCGYLLADSVSPQPQAHLLGSLLGAGLAALAVLLERLLERYCLWALIGGAAGLTLGLLLGRLIGLSAAPTDPTLGAEARLWSIGAMGFLGSLGWAVGFRKGQESTLGSLIKARDPGKSVPAGRLLLMDTSVIIDGRIADVCASGFLGGPLAIPQFVLRELQKIADSPDPLKRARGRRGLDVLRAIQDQDRVEVRILDQEPSSGSGGDVDSRLVEMAREMGCALLTNDLNMHKVAEVRGVRVLNINQLAHALKPVVLPGEELRVRIIKEGREEGQGVGYLEDGTMVVVDNGKRFLGRNVDAVVTSVIQTSAGRMIFTSLKEDQEVHAQNARG